MTITPFSPELATELAQREAFFEATRQQRVANAQSLIASCFPPTELRLVDVLVPYTTFEGDIRYRKVPTWKYVVV